eukprot:86055-Pelagomonas_calceolata.AAC.12
MDMGWLSKIRNKTSNPLQGSSPRNGPDTARQSARLGRSTFPISREGSLAAGKGSKQLWPKKNSDGKPT